MINYKSLKIVKIIQKMYLKIRFVKKLLILKLIKIQDNLSKKIRKIFKFYLNVKISVK